MIRTLDRKQIEKWSQEWKNTSSLVELQSEIVIKEARERKKKAIETVFNVLANPILRSLKEDLGNAMLNFSIIRLGKSGR